MSVFDMLLSEDFPARESEGTPVADRATPAAAQPAVGGGEQLLPAPVLAESPDVNPVQGVSGEARESTETPTRENPNSTDSRGGQNTLVSAAVTTQPDASSTSGALASTLDQVVAFLRRYIVFPNEDYFPVLALWAAHTWVYEAFQWTPYLIIKSPLSECGKTTVLDCLKATCHNGWEVVVPTAAALYAYVEDAKPTILIDEYHDVFNDSVKSEAGSALKSIIKAGFKKGAVVPRRDMRPGAKHRVEMFETFSPKALAGVGGLEEQIESRAIHIYLRRNKDNEAVAEFDEDTSPEEAAGIRTFLENWARESMSLLKKSQPERPVELSSRQKNFSKPLLAVADMAGGDWPARARLAIVRICKKDRTLAAESQLLYDIRDIFLTASVDKMSTTDLLDRLICVQNANSPWPSKWENDVKRGNTGSPGRQLSEMLSDFGIKPHTLRFGGDAKKGYRRGDFAEAWLTYLQAPAKAETAELDLEL